MLLSNLKKWSRAIPTVSSFLTKAPINNVSKNLIKFTPQVDNFFLQTKSLSFTSQEFFGCFKLKERGPCLPHKGKSRFNSAKRREKRKASHYKLPNHKGLLRRLRIVNSE